MPEKQGQVLKQRQLHCYKPGAQTGKVDDGRCVRFERLPVRFSPNYKDQLEHEHRRIQGFEG